jgi:hypothetical protein
MSALICLEVHLIALLQTKYGVQKLPSLRSSFFNIERWILLGRTQNPQDLKKLRTLYEKSYFAGTCYMEKDTFLFPFFICDHCDFTKYELNNKRHH